MISTRQLEAFVWAVRLKTLSRAAGRLNMAQPTISKRIQELEYACGFDVFAKQGRSIALTEEGKELYEIAEQIVALLQQVSEIRGHAPERLRNVGIGVTEMVAYTWLPKMVRSIAERHPLVEPHITIEQSASLLTKIRSGELDLIVTPAFSPEAELTDLTAAEVHVSLMASPQLCEPGRVYSGEALSELALISHGSQTGSIHNFKSWMGDIGWFPKSTIEMDSIAAQVGLAVAGMGLPILPSQCFQFLVDSGRLIEVRTATPPPTLRYRIVYRQHEKGGEVERVAESIKQSVDFKRQFQI